MLTPHLKKGVPWVSSGEAPVLELREVCSTSSIPLLPSLLWLFLLRDSFIDEIDLVDWFVAKCFMAYQPLCAI